MPSHTRSLVGSACALGLAAVTLAAGACASLSGLSGGGDDAGHGPLDATGGDHHRVEASADDAHVFDARDEKAVGVDAPIPPDHDVPGDASVDAPRLGFCASYPVPDGSTLACDDFDENPDATTLGVPMLTSATATLVVEPDAALSPPNALSVNVLPTDGGATSFAYLSHTVGTVEEVTVDCELLLLDESAIGPANTFNLTISSSNGTGFNRIELELVRGPGPDSGITGVIINETDYQPLDASETYNIRHGTVNYLWSGWVHVVLSITKNASGLFDSLTLNGTVYESNVKLAADYSLTDTRVEIGFPYVTYAGLRRGIFDDVAILSR